MKKAIVTTTINPPTEALIKFLEIAKRDDWRLCVVGDKKTDHKAYKVFKEQSGDTDRVIYLAPEDQEAMSKDLSDLIAWNCIQRRNFGLLAAWQWGAEVIATVDDDNIPYDNWGKDILVGKSVKVDIYETESDVFNPLARHDFGYEMMYVCKNEGIPEEDDDFGYYKTLWHRGIPIQQITNSEIIHKKPSKKELRKILVQADLWNGDPDIDAVTRIVLSPEVKFEHNDFYAGNKIGPFNSQNTFLHRDIFPTYFLFPAIGRMDDIWASYATQFKFPNSVVYGPATVYQKRNPHDLSKDLEAEMIGYKYSGEFVKSPNNWQRFLPAEALASYRVWQTLFT